MTRLCAVTSCDRTPLTGANGFLWSRCSSHVTALLHAFATSDLSLRVSPAFPGRSPERGAETRLVGSAGG